MGLFIRTFTASVFLVVVFAASGCASFMDFLGFGYTQPKVELKTIEVRNISFGAIRLDVKLQVTNPNRFDLKLSKMDYTISASEALIASGSIESALNVPAGGQSDIKLPLKIDPEAAMRLINKLLEKPNDDLPALVTANMEFDTPVGRMQKTFSQEKMLNKIMMSKH